MAAVHCGTMQVTKTINSKGRRRHLLSKEAKLCESTKSEISLLRNLCAWKKLKRGEKEWENVDVVLTR